MLNLPCPTHDVGPALIRLAGQIEGRPAGDGAFDPALDDLEREFAELLCAPGLP